MTVAEYNSCVDKYSDGVYRFILKNIKDEDNAKDIVQDAFVKMWNKRETINFEKSRSYLFTTAYHTMIDYIRKDKKQTSLENVNEDNYSVNTGFSDTKEIINEALEKLTDIQKSVILLRDYEGYSYKEIGEITDLNESQVKVYIYRARIILKNYIGNLEVVI
ncbi:MAG: RNA polymerase sigma factor [Bacteroidales bacterium]|nr:RNA polymerase sigma factor [Bacteroidales bacterium]